MSTKLKDIFYLANLARMIGAAKSEKAVETIRAMIREKCAEIDAKKLEQSD